MLTRPTQPKRNFLSLSGKTTLLFDRGYNTNDKVRCTNIGGGKMNIERLKPGKTLTMHFQIQDYI